MSESREMITTIFHWTSDPYDIYTRKMLSYFDEDDEQVSLPSGEIIVKTKYHTNQKENVEYFYQVQGSLEAIQEICQWMTKAANQPLRLAYLGDLDLKELQGVLTILAPVFSKVLGVPVKRVMYTRYTHPAYIEFTPISNQILSEEYDVLKKYSYHRRPTLDTLSQVQYFEPRDIGNEAENLIYISGSQLADVMSQIHISEFVGYTLLAKTPLVYLALENWTKEYDYDEERAFSSMKRWRDMVLIRNDDAYLESLFWDLSDTATYLESQGWFSLSESMFDLEGLEIYDKVAKDFGMKTAYTTYYKDLHFYQQPQDLFNGFFSPQTWLEDSVSRIYQGSPPIVRISGEWSIRMEFKDTELYKVAYAAQQAYASLENKNPLLQNFSLEVMVLPDFSIQVPLYNKFEQLEFSQNVESMLQYSENIQGVQCKDISHCQAALEKTRELSPNTKPLIITMGDRKVLVNNGPIFTPQDKKDFETYLTRATKKQKNQKKKFLSTNMSAKV